MTSKADRNKIKAKQDIKEQPRTNTEIGKKSKFKVQIYLDPGESNDDFSQPQSSQNYDSSCYMFQEVHNISSNVRKESMNSNFRSSQVKKVKPKSPLDICKRNILNVTKKGDGKITQSEQIPIIQGTKDHEQMDDQNTVKAQVNNSVQKIHLFSTLICTPNKDEDCASVKDSEAKNDEEYINMSTINGEGKFNQQIKNNKFTLEGEPIPTPAAEYRIQNGDDDCSDYALFSDCVDEPTAQASNTTQNVRNDEDIDYSVHEMSSATSSPSHYMNESIPQTNTESDVLPQHSPLNYVSLDSYSVSTIQCTSFYRTYMKTYCKHDIYYCHYTILGYHSNTLYRINMLHLTSERTCVNPSNVYGWRGGLIVMAES
jgi:hypothetical protein